MRIELPEGKMNFAFEGGDESPHSISEAGSQRDRAVELRIFWRLDPGLNEDACPGLVNLTILVPCRPSPPELSR